MKLWWCVISTLAVVGCGGGETGPKPLKYTLDDVHIAGIALDQKRAVIDSKQEFDVALMERQKVESDLNDAKTQLEIARNERSAAELKENSARTERKAAAKTADITRQNSAERELHISQLGRRAADGKISWLKAHIRSLKKRLKWAQHNVYAKEARWQLEKAKVAQKNNIRPKGFEFAKFEAQGAARAEAAKKANVEAESERQAADEKQRDWQARVKEHDRARGITASDDASAAPTTAPAAPTPSK